MIYRDRTMAPTLQLCEVTGRIDYIDENDRKLGEDMSGSGSEWYPDEPDITLIPIVKEDPEGEETLVDVAVSKLLDYGLTETSSAPDFYHPDGSRISNYRTGERKETTARLLGMSDEEVTEVCERIERSAQ